MKNHFSTGLKRKCDLAKAFGAKVYYSSRDKEKSQKYLAKTMGSLKGLPQKIGQFLSLSISNDEQKTSITPFMELCENAESVLSTDEVQMILNSELNLSSEDYQISKEPIGTGSLSQVHDIQFKNDSQTYVAKVKYPNKPVSDKNSK